MEWTATTESLVEFYNQVHQLNEGFDVAAALRAKDNTGSGFEFSELLDCNIEYALHLTPGKELEVLPLKTVGTRLPPRVRDDFAKSQCTHTLFDKAMAVIDSHRNRK